MRKYLQGLLLMAAIFVHAQKVEKDDSGMLTKRNEIRFDIGKLLVNSRL